MNAVPMHQAETTDDLEVLFACLPPHIAERLRTDARREDLIEVVMDLGRLPEARYFEGEQMLSDHEVTPEEIEYVVHRVGQFNEDNRAGLERTLHRISAIRNRNGRVVGLTCRVGRAVFGTIKIIEDLVTSGKSILLLGRPGIGKTTMLRETARVLADDFNKRVVIVDTSNEIAGDGDIPHPAIGHARRMQVPQPQHQHRVMIEAVENHMPEVIVIDEIGTEQEAAAARTIAERGVQLIGTAHGTSLENLIQNPTLSDLIGGIQAVTLGDEEARRRRTRKTVLERKAPPTFDVIVELRSRTQVAVHADVGRTVDALLRGIAPRPQLRKVSSKGTIEREDFEMPPAPARDSAPEWRPNAFQDEEERGHEESAPANGKRETTDIYVYGIGKGKLEDTFHTMGLPFRTVDNVHEADIVLTTKQLYRRKSPAIRVAEEARTPVYVLRKNTPVQLEQALRSIASARGIGDDVEDVLEETEDAVQRILSDEVDEVELSPANSYVRRLQHQLAQQASLESRSSGREPNRRVRIFKNAVAAH
jgi:stage III sporulation protein SpoIIIAA